MFCLLCPLKSRYFDLQVDLSHLQRLLLPLCLHPQPLPQPQSSPGGVPTLVAQPPQRLLGTFRVRKLPLLPRLVCAHPCSTQCCTDGMSRAMCSPCKHRTVGTLKSSHIHVVKHTTIVTCNWCHAGATGYGIDRMSPEASCHDLDNLVSCCYPCNRFTYAQTRDFKLADLICQLDMRSASLKSLICAHVNLLP